MFGPSGCGKTRSFVREQPDGCCLPVNNGFWFDGYEGHDAVLLDEFAGKMSKWSLVDTKRIIDTYTPNVPVKGSFVNWRPTKIYIATNVHPKDWYDYSDRTDEYIQIVRRISQVRWWKQRNQEAEIIYRPANWPEETEDRHTHFFYPPGARGAYYNSDTGRYETENTTPAYNF